MATVPYRKGNGEGNTRRARFGTPPFNYCIPVVVVRVDDASGSRMGGVHFTRETARK